MKTNEDATLRPHFVCMVVGVYCTMTCVRAVVPLRSVTSTIYTPAVPLFCNVMELDNNSACVVVMRRPVRSYNLALSMMSLEDAITVLRSGEYAHTLLPVVDTLGWVVEVVTPSEPR